MLVEFALIHVPEHLGYFALFGLIAAESAGAPLPGETALIASGVLASQGQMSIETVIVVAALAAIIGDNVGYVIGRTGGRALLERPGLGERHRRALLHHGQPFFEKHGAKAVFLGRWFAGLRIAAAWLAGINHMHWATFGFWNALGGIAWALTVGLVAYALGPTAERLFSTLGIAGVALVVLVGVFFGVRHLRRRGLGEPGDGDGAAA